MGSFLLGELMWWLDACLEEGRRVGKVGIFRVVHRFGGGMGGRGGGRRDGRENVKKRFDKLTTWVIHEENSRKSEESRHMVSTA